VGALALGAAIAPRPAGSAKKGRRIKSGKIVGWTDDGDPIYASRKRPRRFRGRSVNPVVKPPKPPGPWVDDERCQACGALFDDFHAGIDFADAAHRLRQLSGGYRAGGGYRTRGPVLWMMHVMKLEDWYREHAPHGWEYQAQQHQRRRQQRQRQHAQAQWRQRTRRARQVPLEQVPF